MPDPQSGLLSKQEKRIISEFNEGKKPSQDFIADSKNRSQLYNTGIDILEALGYRVQLSEKGAFCLHNIYKAVTLGENEIKGINYPQDFMPYMPVTDINDIYELYDNFCEEAGDEQLIEFWTPLWIKPANTSPLENFAYSKLNLEKQAFVSKIKRDDVLELYHSFYYGIEDKGDEFYKSPLTWIPAKAWFCDKVKKLRFKDIFTIFPTAELELFKLILGRIGVGISGHQPPGTDEVISHTFRMAGIMIGREAG